MGSTPHQFSMSEKLQEMVCLVGQSTVFKDGEALFKELSHIDVSAKQIQRVSERYGQLLEEKNQESMRQEENFQKPKDKDLTYVMPDGSMVFTREEGWKEVKLCRIFQSKQLVKIQAKRNEILDSEYVGHLGCHLDFWPKVEHCIECYQNMVCIADGASWIWNWASDKYPNMVQILDFYHAMEKMGSFATLQYPDKKVRQRWIRQQKQRLLADKVQRVIDTVCKLIPRTKEAAKAQETLIGYYNNHSNRMMYRSYREKGYLIGSGPIESAHRNVVQQRLKRSGQRWTKIGAQQILTLRICYQSNRQMDIQKLMRIAA